MEIVIAGVFSLAGVFLGWLLSRSTVREERAFTERLAVRARQDDAAAKLDEGVSKGMEVAPHGTARGAEGRAQIYEARKLVVNAWSRTTVLADQEIDDRIWALSMVLSTAGRETERRPDDDVNCWPLDVAFRDARARLQSRATTGRSAYARDRSCHMP